MAADEEEVGEEDELSDEEALMEAGLELDEEMMEIDPEDLTEEQYQELLAEAEELPEEDEPTEVEKTPEMLAHEKLAKKRAKVASGAGKEDL